jgi:hypothetical protein
MCNQRYAFALAHQIGGNSSNVLHLNCSARIVSRQAVHVLQAAGVPTVPGSDGLVKDQEEAIRVAREVSSQTTSSS